MEQGLAGVAVGEMAEPAFARLGDPAGGGGLAVVGAIAKEQVNALVVSKGACAARRRRRTRSRRE